MHDIHARNRLRQRESRDKEAGILPLGQHRPLEKDQVLLVELGHVFTTYEGGIALIADVELKDKFPRIGKDGGERDWFCYSHKSCRSLVS